MNSKKILLATIDLGAHSCRMLVAEGNTKTHTLDILEDLDVSIPLGSDVFRTGAVSDESIRMLCGIFGNFRTKLDEYGVKNYRAIATSAVREASNADILIERIAHATGLRLTIFEGADEARLNYLTVRSILPKKFDFERKSLLIADIGTGACQISSCEGGSFSFTETIKLGTLRVIEQAPEMLSSERIRASLTPVIDKAFHELHQIAPNVKSRYIVAMGASVRTLLGIFGPGSGGVRSIRRKDYDTRIAETLSMSLEKLSDTYGIPSDLAEAVIPCSIIIDNLFRITGAGTLLVPMVSTKQGLINDFFRALEHREDGFAWQIEEMVRRTAGKYRSDAEYIRRTALFADKLFIQLQELHGCSAREALLLRIAAFLHKTGLFINNQAYHKHSYYIIDSTEIPGISPSERRIAALVARYHRKAYPRIQHPEFAALDPAGRASVLKLSAILRIACGLAETCRSVTQFQADLESDRVILTPESGLEVTGFALPRIDIDYFDHVFAIPLIVR